MNSSHRVSETHAQRVATARIQRALRFLLAVLMCVLPPVTLAQVTGGSITGTVRGDSGSAIPGVQVSIKDVTTGQLRTIQTDTSGSYSLPALPVGNYELTVSAPGFVTQVLRGITVAVGSQRVLDIHMRPGSSQTVVRATVPGVSANPSSGNVGKSVVENTPLNGRDWTQLATLQAGVTGVQTGSSTGGGNTERGFGAPVSISGARPDQNSYRLDGISINDYSNGAPGSVLGDNLGIDAVEQVSVLGSNYPAEYGRTSGGVINAVTRSGTKAFHGDIYEFFRNSALDARNFFDGRIPPFKRNQFGGSAGGPLQTDRMFIFGDYEGLRQSLGVTTVDTVPSAAALGRNTGPNGGPGLATLCSIRKLRNSFHRTVAQQLRFPLAARVRPSIRIPQRISINLFCASSVHFPRCRTGLSWVMVIPGFFPSPVSK